MSEHQPRAIDLAPLAESVGKLNRAFDELAALATPGGHPCETAKAAGVTT